MPDETTKPTKIVNGDAVEMTQEELEAFQAALPAGLTFAEKLAKERAAMTISPMQGILTLGEANWNQVLAYRETATWAEKVVIDSAKDWQRNSQNIAFFGYLLGFTDEQMDELFRNAAMVVV